MKFLSSLVLMFLITSHESKFDKMGPFIIENIYIVESPLLSEFFSVPYLTLSYRSATDHLSF
jgi:hypothetical protein